MALSTNQTGFLARKRWLLWAAGIAAAVVLLASFMSRGEIVPVRVATVERSTIRSLVSTNGKVEPLQNFEAHAPVGTTIKKLLIKEGQPVKKGQLLVQLDDAEASSQAARALSQVRAAQAQTSAVQSGGTREEVLTLDSQLVKARNSRDTAQRNLEALRRLQENGAASPGEVKQAEDQLAAAESDLKLIQEKQKGRYSAPEIAHVEAQTSEAQSAYNAAEDVLRQLNIRAPFDGIVYSLPVHQGTYVNPGDLVLQEADLSKVLVRAYVDEPDVGRLAHGQTIELTWDAMPGRTWQGTVNTVPSAVKLLGTRNVGEATCVVDNQDLKLLPNINVGVTIVTAEHRNALTVPREAVRLDDGKTFVFQVVNDELQRRDIQTSISNLTRVEVTGGVTDNAVLALASTNSKPLHEGLAVKVVR
ncbi:MAG TPA: efflux RND transporter periplasmic adaptor subunit [Terriglobales bacterium]|jgi:HlyD family secretion protein|nr:efflux RND transporter periplasmic adaptor subunit [Terriglobales bacterium]